MPSSTSSTARTRLISRVASSECPPSSKKLSSMPTAATPRTSANRPHRISSCGDRGPRRDDPTASGAGSERRSSLPFGVSGSASSTTIDDGTRYSGRRPDSAARSERPSSQNRPEPEPEPEPEPRAHHVADKTPLPRAVLPDHNRRLRHTRLAKQRRLDLAGLDPMPAKLDLRIRTPQELQHAVRTPARQVPGPVHPAASRAMRVRDKPLRRQTRTPQVARATPRPAMYNSPGTPEGNASRPDPRT